MPEPKSLRRELSFWDVFFLVMGGIIGAGIFYAPHRVAFFEPSVVNIILTWSIGGVLALCGAIVFAELGALYPETGGQYVFIRNAFGRFLSFLFAWSLLTIIVSGAISVIAGICIGHLDTFLKQATGHQGESYLPAWTQKTLGGALIVTFTIINVRGIRIGASVHNVLMTLKIVGIVAVIAMAVIYGLGSSHTSGFANAPTHFRADKLGTALLAVLFSFGGWQNVCAIAGEVKDAKRIIPRAVILGTIVVIVLYISLNLAVIELLGVKTLAAETTKTPVADAAAVALGPPGAMAVSLLVVLSTIGITHALLLMSPRIVFAMARDGLFLPVCGRTHPRFQTPYVSIILLAAIAIGYHVGMDIGETMNSLAFVDWVFFSLCGIAYFVFRYRDPERPRPYRATWHPIPPLIFLVLALTVVISNLLNDEDKHLKLPAILFAAGILLYAAFLWARPNPTAKS